MNSSSDVDLRTRALGTRSRMQRIRDAYSTCNTQASDAPSGNVPELRRLQATTLRLPRTGRSREFDREPLCAGDAVPRLKRTDLGRLSTNHWHNHYTHFALPQTVLQTSVHGVRFRRSHCIIPAFPGLHRSCPKNTAAQSDVYRHLPLCPPACGPCGGALSPP